MKGIRNPKPWKVNRNVGPVVVLCGGKIRDNGDNYLCSLDTEGKCTVYDVGGSREEVGALITINITTILGMQGPVRCHFHLVITLIY